MMEWARHVATAVGEGLAIFVSLIRQVPDVVWAALIAAGVAFLTTALSNRYNARERARDRAMALRRDVYLPAIEAVARANGALGHAANLDVDLAEVSKQITADLATIAKVHLVASEATVRGLLAFQKALMPAYLELITRRMPLVARRGAIQIEQHLIDRALAEQQKFVQMLQELNLSGNNDAAARERLNVQFNIADCNFREHSEKQAALQREQMADHLSITARLAELLPLVTRFMPETLISARKELELPIDPAEYARLFQETQEAAQRAMRDLIEHLQRQTGGDS